MLVNSKYWNKRWWGVILAVVTLAVVLSFSGVTKLTQKKKAQIGVSKTKSTTSQSQATTPAAPQTHTVQYQFSLFGGSISSSDEQNIGISWHDPTSGQNQLPSDIQSAAQQINAGSYTVSYQVDSVNLSNLRAGITNYNDPDAVITCTILVDGNAVDSQAAPKSGYADCSGDNLDSKSGT